MKLYSNVIVFRGHPDKVCDQISDAILDECLKQDKLTRAGIEVMGGKGKIFITGEITTKAKINVTEITNDGLISYIERIKECQNKYDIVFIPYVNEVVLCLDTLEEWYVKKDVL